MAQVTWRLAGNTSSFASGGAAGCKWVAKVVGLREAAGFGFCAGTTLEAGVRVKITASSDAGGVGQMSAAMLPPAMEQTCLTFFTLYPHRTYNIEIYCMSESYTNKLLSPRRLICERQH